MAHTTAYWHRSELNEKPKRGFISASEITPGHKALLAITIRDAGNKSGCFERNHVVSRIIEVNDDLHIEFESLHTDEPIVISASAYVKGRRSR